MKGSKGQGQGQHEISTDDVRRWSSKEQENEKVNMEKSIKCPQIKKLMVLPCNQNDCVTT